MFAAAPLVIATGGVNRHNGIIEGREFACQLTEAGVPDGVIRVEDQSKDTWQNVELSPPSMTPNPTAKPRTEQHARSSKGAAPQGDPTIYHPQPNRRSHHMTNG